MVHRDLKPSNLLVNRNCDVMISDFGLSRGIASSNEAMTEYVVTRWYRAPELLAECHYDGKAVDVWSIGIIFAELILRKHLFISGRNTSPLQQLLNIIEAIGCDSIEDLSFFQKTKMDDNTTTAIKKIILKAHKNNPKPTPTGLRNLLPKNIEEVCAYLLFVCTIFVLLTPYCDYR